MMTRLFAGAFLLAVAGCGGSETAGTSPTSVLATLEVSFSRSSVNVGETVMASALAYDQSGHLMSPGTVTWSSYSPSIASVSSSGVVTGVSAGSAIIQAATSGFSSSKNITVIGQSIASLTLTAPTTSVVTKGTLQLTATARSSAGALVSGRSTSWSTNAPGVLTVSSSGLVTAVNPGSASITAGDEATGITGTLALSVVSPPRPAGSLLKVGADSVDQFGSSLYVSTLVYVDTAVAGKDLRVGVIMRSGAQFLGPISRSDFPRLSAIAECPGGEVYGVSYSILNGQSVTLWRIVPTTGTASAITTLGFYLGSAPSMACESSTRLYLSELFGGSGSLYAVNPMTPTYQTVIDITSNRDTFLGLASSPLGLLYAATQNLYTTSAPYPQLLVTVNTSNGTLTPVGTNQQRQVPVVWQLAFRGSRLMGFTLGGQLVEVNTQTGAVSTIRSTGNP